MGKKNSSGGKTKRKITRKDIKGAESIPELIKQLVSRVVNGDDEGKELAASGLMQIAQMDHGAHAKLCA